MLMRVSHCVWVGIDIDPFYIKLAKRYCHTCLTVDVDSADEAFWQGLKIAV
jgi:hypothetical protein